jgi:hypothetical protein
MTIGELMAMMQTMDPHRKTFVALFTADGTVEECEIDAVQDDEGDAQLDMYKEEEALDEPHGNGVVRHETP